MRRSGRFAEIAAHSALSAHKLHLDIRAVPQTRKAVAHGLATPPAHHDRARSGAHHTRRDRGSDASARQAQEAPRVRRAHKADFFHGGTDAHETYQRAAGTWNEGRHLIIPTYLKDLSTNRLLVHLWNQAGDALATATSIVIIGFP